jgi:hypothetical protein
LDRSAWIGRPDKSAWKGQTGQTERSGCPEHDNKNMTARTAGTGKWGTRVLRQASRTGQVDQASCRGQLGHDNGGRAAMTRKIQQDS